MPNCRTAHCLFATAIVCTAAARPQTPPLPPPPPPASYPAADTFFNGVEKFERSATRVTRVENDHNHGHQAEPGAPRRLSTVYVFNYDGPGRYNPADVEPYRRKLRTTSGSEPAWTCKTCDHHLQPGETIDACTRPLGPSSVESVVIQMRPDQLTFVHTVGGTPRENNVNCSDN